MNILLKDEYNTIAKERAKYSSFKQCGKRGNKTHLAHNLPILSTRKPRRPTIIRNQLTLLQILNGSFDELVQPILPSLV